MNRFTPTTYDGRLIACGGEGTGTMARIDYFDLAQAPAAYKELLGDRPPLNLYRMLPHAGPAAIGFLTLGGALLRRSELDPPLREIAILRVGMISGASYEVHQHKRVARKAGLAPEKIAALTEPGGNLGVFDETERFVIAFTDRLVHHVKADDAMFAAAQTRFNPRQLSELVLTIGFYMMVSRFLENFEVDIEPPGTFG
jgi:alkylhydroperoxidase family enzyme